MLLLIASLAFGSDLVIQADVPAEIRLDGQVLAQLFWPGELRTPISVGSHELTIYRNGSPETLMVDARKGLDVVVSISDNGARAGEALERAPESDGTIAVELRAGEQEGALVTLGEARHLLAPGAVLNVKVREGETPMTVRNTSGTVVWARGMLHATSGPLIIDIAAGRLPRVPSLGGKFVPGLE